MGVTPHPALGINLPSHCRRLMLVGLTVIELGEFVAVPMCGKLLAGLGAEVIKVEPPGLGDRARRHGPFPGDIPHLERSGMFLQLNVNKSAVTLDPATAEGRALLAGLLDQADVLVTDVSPARRAEWGLEAAALTAAHPALVLASITPFGMTGPLSDEPGDDLLCNALSGTAWAIGEPGRAPLQMPLFQCDQQAGIAAAGAVLAALISRLGTGRGQVLDLSTADVMAAYAGTNAAIFFPYGRPYRRAGTNANGHGGPYPYAIFPCKDGHVAIIARSRADWMKFIDSLGHPDWADDPRYGDQIEISARYAEEVDALLRPLLARYSKDELFALAQQWGYPLAPLRTLAEAVAEPQFAHRRFFAQVPVEGGPPLRLPNLPYRFSGWPQPPVRPAPGLGADNARILGGRLGLTPEALAQLSARGVI